MEQARRQSRIEAESLIGLGRVRVTRNQWDKPIDIRGSSNLHHLELSLLPSSDRARARFVEHWEPRRFEPFGQVFLLPAGQTVHALSECREQISVVCSLDPDALERWCECKFEWQERRLENLLDIANTRIRSLLFQIGEEVRVPGFGGEAMVELLTAQVAIELSRYLVGLEDNTVRGGLPAWRLSLIDQRLADDSMPPSLAELAELCDMSVRHLSRAFRASRGRSIGSYIAEQRMKHAKRMLASGMSVKAVAYSTGFSAPSNFTAAFVRETGEPPRQFRARALRGPGGRLFAGRDIH